MSKSSKKNVPKKNSSVRPYTVMCTDLYLLWILLVYPLYYADGYFHLPERKATFWCTSTLIYIGVTLLGVIITYVSTRDEWSLERIKKNISMTDVFMFGFLISNLIAFALSEDKTNAWTGAGARYYGAKVLILVCISYFLISRYAWVNKVFIWAFLIGGNGVCLLATFDYFGMDVLGINQQMQASDWLMFISTMGNANTCASFVTMTVAGAICYFCVAKDMKSKVFAGISIVNCSVALITARSDSAFVGIAAIGVVLCVLMFVKKIDVKTIVGMAMLVDVAFVGLTVLKRIYPQAFGYDLGIPLLLMNAQGILIGSLIALILIYAVTSYIERKNITFSKNTIKMVCIAGVFVLIGIVVVILSKINFIEMFKTSMGLSEGALDGNRAYIYNRTVRAYFQAPILNKLFGCGQASVSTLLNQCFGEELASMGILINSAHNNILDYLIMGGLFGAICYLGILVSEIKKGLSMVKKSPMMMVFTGCVIAYFAQGLFNIEQSNTTTIFWVLLACMEAIDRQYAVKKETM